jgi:hypothetical protein
MSSLTEAQVQVGATKLLGPGATLRMHRVILPEAKAYVDMFYIELDGVIRGIGGDWEDAIADATLRF